MTPTRIAALAALSLGLLAAPPEPLWAADPPPAPKYEPFETFMKGAKETSGLFNLYQKDDHLYMEVRPDQLERPLLAPISIAKGAGRGGETLNFDEQWVLLFKKVGEKIFVVRRNVRFQAKAGSPAAAAVETTYSDSVLMAVPIKTLSPRGGSVIDLNQIFFTDFGLTGLGFVDRERTTWHRVKAFKGNVELEVAATFQGGRGAFSPFMGGDDSVIDPRGTTAVIHYGLVALPEYGYTPRLADDRVGHFLSAVKDFSSDSKDSAFVRYVNRWRLERADGSPWKEGGKLQPPKKKIVFWIEKTVPDEYRAAVREGILEWNKAFEKIGFRDAIEVRQQENEEFEPEDVGYNTFRWIVSDQGFAIGPSRANPLTGELLDADILFDASMVRYYKTEAQLFRTEAGLALEPASAIETGHRGWNLPRLRDEPETAAGFAAAQRRALRSNMCQCASHKTTQLGMAITALAVRDGLKPGDRVPEELIQQAVKDTTMHEVGHTLGLRHNFKASTTLKNDQLHNTDITRKQGLAGSVMDYNPVNLAPKGTKQGDYFTTTLGAYDYWAIEYAYKPLGGGTESEAADLAKVAERGAAAGLDFATDEDLFLANDPLTNQWDLGADVLQFGIDRANLADELVKGLADRVVEKGESYARLRLAFRALLRQYGDAAYLASRHVGGEVAHRDHRGDPNGRDPLVPVAPAKQRQALKFVAERVLGDGAFSYPPELLRKLQIERWSHWGQNMNSAGFDLPGAARSIQTTALDNLLGGATLSRVQDLACKAAPGEEPLQVAEVFRAVSDAVWIDLPNGDKAGTGKSSVIRRNLQREYLKRLSTMVLGRSAGSMDLFALLRGGFAGVPSDARSLARMHLREAAKRVDAALGGKTPLDDATRAHLEEVKEQVAKVLAASLAAQP